MNSCSALLGVIVLFTQKLQKYVFSVEVGMGEKICWVLKTKWCLERQSEIGQLIMEN